ncbi:hypothetical protein R6Q57_023254 [Mikania cordata]
MGFGSLLNFMVDGIPGRLAHYVIEKFDDKKMVIRVGGHKIRVNKESIKNLLGLSCEGRMFEQITPLDVLDKSVKGWRDPYEGRFIGASHLVDNILHSEDKDDFNFRLNFVMMFVVVLVECTKNGRMKEDILRYFYHGANFKQFDWCDFIIEKTRGCKSGWMPYDNSFEYKGIKLDPRKQAISFWTKAIFKEKGKAGDKGWGFGKGRLKEFVGVEERDTAEGDQVKFHVLMLSIKLIKT